MRSLKKNLNQYNKRIEKNKKAFVPEEQKLFVYSYFYYQNSATTEMEGSLETLPAPTAGPSIP
mgnify:CR=1 FL=1